MRARWHAAAFGLLVAGGADPAESAEHAARAGVIGDPEAVAVLAQAGRTAMREGAIARAKQWLLAAVDVAGSRAEPDLLMDLGEVQLDSGDGRGAIATCQRILAIPDLSDRLRSPAQRMLGRAHFIRGGVREAGEAFRAAVASALPSEKSEAVRALLDEAFISWPSGGPALATPLLERARELAIDVSPRLRARADTAWAFSTFLRADPTGIAVIEGAVRDALANPEADTTDFAWSWGTLGTYGNMTKWTERFTEATRAYDIGMQAAERMRLPVAIAALAVMHGDTCIRMGKLQEALQLPTGPRCCPILPPSGPSGPPSSMPTPWRRWARWTSARNGTGGRQHWQIRTRPGRDGYGCSISRPCWPCTPGVRPTRVLCSTGYGRWPIGFKFWSPAWSHGLGMPSPPICMEAESTTPGRWSRRSSRRETACPAGSRGSLHLGLEPR